MMTHADVSFGLAEIGQVALTVTDVDRAITFYRDTLGMRFLFRTPTLAFFDCAGIRLMLGLPEPNGESFHGIIYFKVADIQKAVETLSQRGVTFEAQPQPVARLEKHDLWLAALRDPDRNAIELMCEMPRQ